MCMHQQATPESSPAPSPSLLGSVASSLLLLSSPWSAAKAGLLADQPYGGSAGGDAASRVLVLDRERVEKLLANEFKERLHALPNDQLVQMLDELLASQATTAPELFADVLNRQQAAAAAQQQQPGADVPQQLGGALRRGLSQLWGFSQSRSNPSLVPSAPVAGGGSTGAVTASSSSTVDSGDSVDAAASAPQDSSSSSSPQGAWRAPWASSADKQQQEAQPDPLPAVADSAAGEGSEPQSPTWQQQFGRRSAAPALQQQQEELTEASARADAGAPQQAVQPPLQAANDDAEAFAEDAAESDITRGLLFGSTSTAADASPAAAAAGTSSDADSEASQTAATGGGLATAAAAKLQGLLQGLQPSSAVQPGDDATQAAAEAAGAGAAISSTLAAAGDRLQGLLALPGGAADSLAGALDDLRYDAADAVSSLLDEQGATIAAVLGLTAAAGGGVLLLSAALQPLLNGELASGSKLSALLQDGGSPPPTPEPAAAGDASSGAQAAAGAAAAAAGSADVEAAAAGVRLGLLDNVEVPGDAAAVLQDTWPPSGVQLGAAAADAASSAGASGGGGGGILWLRSDEQPLAVSEEAAGSSSSGGQVLWQRPEEVPAVISSASFAAATQPAAAGIVEGSMQGAGSILWAKDDGEPVAQAPLSTAGYGSSSSSSSSTDAAEAPVLWQRDEAAAAPAAAAAVADQPGRSANGSRRKASRDSWMRRLLSNAEDVVDADPAAAAPAAQEPWQSWQGWPWQQQQQEPPQQQHWQAAAAEQQQQQQQHAYGAAAGHAARDPTQLWPIILATSTTSVAYASHASMDAEVDWTLVPPEQLSPDPWGTSPAGLVPSEEELGQLGVLAAELAGLQAAAAGASSASLAVSPWDAVATGAASAPERRSRGSDSDDAAAAAGGGGSEVMDVVGLYQ